jgi:hypothetical protein
LASVASTGLTPLGGEGDSITGFMVPLDNLRLLEYRSLFSPQSNLIIRQLTSRVNSPPVLAGDGSMLLHHVDGRLSLMSRSNTVKQLKGLELLPSGTITAVHDDQVAGVFVSGLDSSLWFFSRSSEIQQYKSRTREPILCGIRGDVNADGIPDWILGGADGIRVETSDGFLLFRYRTGAQVDHLRFFTAAGKAYISFQSSGNGFLLGRDGLLLQGWPVPGVVNMAFDSTGNRSEVSLASKDGEIRQVSIF